MSQPYFVTEHLIRDHCLHLQQEAEQERCWRMRSPRRDKFMRFPRAGVHQRIRVYRLRWQSRRQRLAQRRCTTDWHLEIGTILDRLGGPGTVD